MSHLKRNKVPKNWSIPRKGTKYVVRPKFNLENSVPLLVVLRDMLKIAGNRKEVKRAIHLKQILMNSKPLKNEKNSMLLFDTLTILPSKKNYRMNLSKKGKFEIEEITEPESHKKVSKIINKKILKGKNVQLNLIDGINFISKEKCKTNDSVLINLKDKKIEKLLPLKEKSEAIVFAGKHAGEVGIINNINQKTNIIELIVDSKKINVLTKQIMIIN